MNNDGEKIDALFCLLEFKVIQDKRLNYATKILYSCIAFSSNNSTGYCIRSNKSLMQLTGISERQFYRDIQQLIDLDYITVIEDSKGKHYMPTTNYVYLQLEERRQKRCTNFNADYYDWLNDRD